VDIVFTAFAVLLFAAVIFLVEGAWMWWSTSHGRGARRIARRLDLMAGRNEGVERINILKQRKYAHTPELERLLRRVPQLAAVDRLLLQAGVRWQVAQLLGAVPNLTVLATSRAPLRLTAEHTYGVQPLAGASAARRPGNNPPVPPDPQHLPRRAG